MFTEKDYSMLHDIVFEKNYPGYKPNVIESPNGDSKLDDKKRYSHVAMKYLKEYDDSRKHLLESYLNIAHNKSLEVSLILSYSVLRNSIGFSY